MKATKTIGIMFVASMLSCSSSVVPAKEQQLNTAETEQAAVEEKPVKEYRKLTEEPGVIFYDMTLEEALEKAKNEGKYVLIDCHTKTCGPCRRMEKEVFPQEKFGQFVNERFVPIMRDIEEGEGLEIAEKYNIQICPTLLVLMPNAAKEGEIVGTEFNIDSLIGMLKTILHEE